MSLVSNVRHRSDRWVLSLASVAAVGIGIVDYITGWEISLFFFYAVPIFLVGYRLSRPLAMLFAFLSTVLWWLGNRENNPYGSDMAYLWVTVTRGAYMAFVAYGGDLLRRYQTNEREKREALEREAELRRQMLEDLEEQQIFFGRELHDGVCQLLGGTLFAADSLTERLEAALPREAGAARDLGGYVRRALAEARQLAHGLFPVQMGAEGLPVALDELATMSNHTMKNRSVKFMQTGSTIRLSPDVAMHLYRIAQEAVANSSKHSKAQSINILLSSDEGRIVLEVADDGCGFVHDAKRRSGIGLRTVTYRAAQIGAQLEIIPGEPRGTRVRCLLSDPGGGNDTDVASTP